MNITSQEQAQILADLFTLFYFVQEALENAYEDEEERIASEELKAYVRVSNHLYALAELSTLNDKG
jgi:hypothetical protein